MPHFAEGPERDETHMTVTPRRPAVSELVKPGLEAFGHSSFGPKGGFVTNDKDSPRPVHATPRAAPGEAPVKGIGIADDHHATVTPRYALPADPLNKSGRAVTVRVPGRPVHTTDED
jgi:hypothetical protein